MTLYGTVVLFIFWTSFTYAQIPISDCQKTYILDSEPGLYCTFYPINITGPVPGFGSKTLRQIVDWQYFNGNSVIEGGTTNLNFNVPISASSSDEVVEGFIYGLPITVSNFTFEGMGWLRAQKTGWHTFNIEANTAAQLYLTNDTRTYCLQNSFNNMNAQFKVTSIPSKPLEENPTGAVYLYAGIPYEVELSYIHMQGSPSLNLSMIDPDGDFHPDISYLIEQLDLYGPGNQVYNYELVNVTTTIGWSGNSTTFLGYSSTANDDYDSFTATTFIIYGTPTPHISSTPRISSLSQMVSTAEATSSSSANLYTGSSSFNRTSAENHSISTNNVTEASSSTKLVSDSIAIMSESTATGSAVTSVPSTSDVISTSKTTIKSFSTVAEPLGTSSSVTSSVSSGFPAKQTLRSSSYVKTTVRADYGNSSVTDSMDQVEISSGVVVGTEITGVSSSLVESKEYSQGETSPTVHQLSTSYYTTAIVITDIVITVCSEAVLVDSGYSQSISYSISTYSASNAIATTIIDCARCKNENKSCTTVTEEMNNSSNDSGSNGNQPVISGNGQPQVIATKNGNVSNSVEVDSKSTILLFSTVASENAIHAGDPFAPPVVTTKDGSSTHPTTFVQTNANSGSTFSNGCLISLISVYISFVLLT